MLVYHPLIGIRRELRIPDMARYEFQAKMVGVGGFEKVIRGRDTELDRHIAVKALNPILSAVSEAERERFKRETKTLARLSHPNIPAVYDVDFSDGKFEIYFQFIEGQNLKRLIEQNGPAQPSAARTWFHQIASALEHAHKLGSSTEMSSRRTSLSRQTWRQPNSSTSASLCLAMKQRD